MEGKKAPSDYCVKVIYSIITCAFIKVFFELTFCIYILYYKFNQYKKVEEFSTFFIKQNE